MCYFRTLGLGSVKLQGVQEATLGKGATKSNHVPACHLPSPTYPNMGFSLRLLLLSEALHSEHQTRNNSLHLNMRKCIFNIQTYKFSWASSYSGFGRVLTTTDFSAPENLDGYFRINLLLPLDLFVNIRN